ncbi:ThiF family adenylyltransferase [Variovorax sp. LjRoot290]|uniref:HesA/MoeB/ThiF family protein n=1 Tax=Variovorax sp. LjRoot290 TaxID=3342316 RepID=UPI003ECC2179
MRTLTFTQPDVEALHAAARERSVETAAVGFVWPAGGRVDQERFLVRDLHEVPAAAYTQRTAASAVLAPQFCLEIANAARSQGCGLLLAHTHPGESGLQGFSIVDDDGESQLAPYFARRAPHGAHFAAVFTHDKLFARPLAGPPVIEAAVVGRSRVATTASAHTALSQYDRQVRAFGIDGQRVLQSLRVAIVGLGGTGSLVAQQLAHLGVRDFLLVDPDVVEPTNLNRVVGATQDDVGMCKIAVAARHIRAINPKAHCEQLARDVVKAEVARQLTGVDFIFGCTDSMASRAVMNQLAYQYLIPCVDVGVAIGVEGDEVRYIAGRAQMLGPGLPCLVCTDLLNGEQVRREMMTEEQRQQDAYIVGAAVAQPAVISLNSTVSSAAVTMFLSAVTGLPASARMLIYDGMRGSVRPTSMAPRAHCIVCSTDGALARGEAWKLPTREEVAGE